MPKPPEAPDGAPLEKWAWAPQRSDGVPEEQNTEHEKQLLEQIAAFLNYSKPLPPETIKELHNYLKRGWYAGVLKTPDSKKVYRGIYLPSDSFRQAYRIPPDVTEGVITNNQWYTAPAGCSSWTTNKTVAAIGAKPRPFRPAPGLAQVVLHAYTAQNQFKFLVCRSGLYKIAGLDANDEKSEVIGLGKIEIFKIEYEIG